MKAGKRRRGEWVNRGISENEWANRETGESEECFNSPFLPLAVSPIRSPCRRFPLSPIQAD